MIRNSFISFLVLTAALTEAEPLAAETKCRKEQAAKLVSLQGKVFFDGSGHGQWRQAVLDEQICQGGRVRVEPYSRASLSLPNGVLLRLDEGAVLSLNGITQDEPSALDLLKGFIHFISRTPKHLEITSPIANAGPEGTEFAMQVDDAKASLWVYEGKVRFFNHEGSVRLSPGQGAETLRGQAPQARIDIKPEDAVNWALFYPPILPSDTESTQVDGAIGSAIADFRRGRIDDALLGLDAIPAANRSPYFFKVRAALRLTDGRVELAEQDIQALTAKQPRDADALALQAIIALTQNRKQEALNLAKQAVASAPESAAVYSALSYAEQGHFALDNALVAARQAARYADHDALTWARLAELQLARGEIADSAQSVQHALALDANLARTQTVAGFSDLLRMDAEEAQRAFEQALQLDSTDPTARLGLGLAKIRRGKLDEGRRDLEIAAVLDPNNALTRSYLGKAYYEERRNALAQDQFDLAKRRDPLDPTPYFYDALKKQSENKPVEALHDMQQSIALNDNRAVTRSSMALDQDAAARSANLARIYNDLGFGRTAQKEAWSSLSNDSSNPSAHRFLADAYIGQPRYRTARASELLQAQLLQPLNVTPVQPQLTSENIGILNSTGPGSLSLNEYDPLFNANGAHVVLNGAYGSNNTKTDNAIVSGIYDKLSMSLGQFHYQTDGFRKNDDYKQNIYNAFAQYAFSEKLNLQIELKSEDIQSGDVPFRLNGFNQNTLRQLVKQDTVRFGGRYNIDPKQLLLLSTFYTTRRNQFEDGGVHLGSDANTFQTEIQHLFNQSTFSITTGLGYLNSADKTQTAFFSAPTTENINTDYFNSYVYYKHHLLPNLTTTLGASFDSYHELTTDRKLVNPKAGIIWNPLKNLTLRAAVFRSIKRPLASNQTIEPTQVAGFTQFFDGNNGTKMLQEGFGLDFNPFKSVYMGGEVIWRDGYQPVTEPDQNQKGKDVLFDQARHDAAHLAYFYWAPFEWAAIRSEYRYEKLSRAFTNGVNDLTNPQLVTTQQVPLTLSLFHPNGLFAKLGATYIDQQVNEVNGLDTNDRPLPLRNINESFWTFDSVVGYRLPKKLGVVSVEVRNLCDNRFNYQSVFDASGPQLSPFIPERQVFGKLSFFY